MVEPLENSRAARTKAEWCFETRHDGARRNVRKVHRLPVFSDLGDVILARHRLSDREKDCGGEFVVSVRGTGYHVGNSAPLPRRALQGSSLQL